MCPRRVNRKAKRVQRKVSDSSDVSSHVYVNVLRDAIILVTVSYDNLFIDRYKGDS